MRDREMANLRLGKNFRYGRKLLTVVQGDCSKCYLKDLGLDKCKELRESYKIPRCNISERADLKSVCFIEVSKYVMKKEDFKKMLKIHLDACDNIVLWEGQCRYTSCSECPFHPTNLTDKDKSCLFYRSPGKFGYERDWRLEMNAKRFIKLYKSIKKAEVGK